MLKVIVSLVQNGRILRQTTDVHEDDQNARRVYENIRSTELFGDRTFEEILE